MHPLPNRTIITDRGSSKAIPRWGIIQESPVQVVGKVLVFCVDEDGIPLDIDPNPRWLPKDMLDC